jgi:hypothetical protein
MPVDTIVQYLCLAGSGLIDALEFLHLSEDSDIRILDIIGEPAGARASSMSCG